MLRPRFQPTPEQLHAAWLRRKRRDWPQAEADALAHPLYGRLVHMDALRQHLQDQRAQRLKWAADMPRTAAGRPQPTTTHPGPGVDRKRLAAGDTDDDD